MKTLCLDSAHRYLVVGLYEDDLCICGCCDVCWKRQSETIFPQLIRLMKQVGWDSDDIDEVVITDGPGSYTGVRIAMSIAKVLCTRKHLPLYTISTLQLYAGMHEHAMVMLDARSARAYCGFLHKGTFIEPEMILTLDEIKKDVLHHEYHLFGDVELIGKQSEETDFLRNFIELRAYYQYVDNIHTLTPRYLKEADAYKAK